MPVNYPLFEIGDRVQFATRIDPLADEPMELDGRVVAVDPHGTFDTDYQDASYDVEVDGFGWFKHIAERALTRL